MVGTALPHGPSRSTPSFSASSSSGSSCSSRHIIAPIAGDAHQRQAAQRAAQMRDELRVAQVERALAIPARVDAERFQLTGQCQKSKLAKCSDRVIYWKLMMNAVRGCHYLAKQLTESLVDEEGPPKALPSSRFVL
jgi:hypothetical protein